MGTKDAKNKRIIAWLVVASVIASIVLVFIIIKSCTREEYRLLETPEIETYIAKNDYASDEQQRFVEAALSLVGKVNYFWGGKSASIGWDDDWGKPRIVSSSGSSATGTEQPFGLDCSGYVSWCFIQTGASPQEMSRSIGEGTWNQWDKSFEIKKHDVQLGDLAFINRYPGAASNHVGIVVGFMEDGEPVIAHCTPTYNNVVVSNCGGQFIYFRRPKFMHPAGEEEASLPGIFC